MILVRVHGLEQRMTQNLTCVSSQLPASPAEKQHKLKPHKSNRTNLSADLIVCHSLTFHFNSVYHLFT